MQSLITIVKDTIVCLNNISFLVFLANMTLISFNVEISLANTTRSDSCNVSRRFWVVLLRQPFEGERMWCPSFPWSCAFALSTPVFLSWETDTVIGDREPSWDHDLKNHPLSRMSWKAGRRLDPNGIMGPPTKSFAIYSKFYVIQ